MRTLISVFIFVNFFFFQSFGQQSAIYTNDLVRFNQALSLYNNKQFLAAQNLFDDVRDTVDDENIEAECAYYIANCAVWLNQKDADELMEAFITEYPTSIKRNAAYLDVANYYFDNGKYAYARKWYDKVDQSNMSRREKEKFNFNNGYAYFKIQRFNEAKKFLNQVAESKEYGAKAKYYLGFIAYEGDNYQEADRLFDEVKDLDTYNKNLSYFQSDMNFKSGDFQGAIDEGLTQLPQANPKEKSELNKIIGESYFNLEQYEKALPYLRAYKGRQGKWNNTDYYQLGYAYYKQGDYEKAISEFNKIIGGENATAQNAYYHLAESYLKNGDKQQALNAFKNASEMDFEPQIKQDATYNYAKLSYEIGNSYESTPKVILDYLETYPETGHAEEMKELLISSYITSKNYQEAIDLIENNRAYQNDEVYQKVTYLRGVELYGEENYQDAITNFNKSLEKPVIPGTQAKALYWKSESNYLLNHYEKALSEFLEFKKIPESKNTAEFQNIEYSIGYANFKLKNYREAASAFDNYVDQPDVSEEKMKDALLRLGDSYFISSNYWDAMKAYNAVIKKGGAQSDYAQYQKAISYGFVKKNDDKIRDLELLLKMYPSSTYKDDALFALGDTYIAMHNNTSGLKAYQKIVSEIPQSSFVPQALLKQGLVYYNDNQSDLALSKFKKVVSDFPGTDESKQAVHTARLLYVDLGRTEEYSNWVKGLDFVEVTDMDLDNTAYEAAEKQFLDQNKNEAIAGFKEYLRLFPKGLHSLQSHFYLAQLYNEKGEKEKAITNYEIVVEKGQSEFLEQSLAKVAQLYLEKQQYQKAIPTLLQLEKIANASQNKLFAQSNLMKSYYQLNNYEQTIAYADKVLDKESVTKEIKNDAQLFTARAAMQTNDETRAQKAYAEVRKNASGEVAAEALYYEAYFLHTSGAFKKSNETVQKLAKDYSGYKLYGAKGLVLMAKNFYQLDDSYQATYILESVIKNFADYPDVTREAQQELKLIKEEEAKTNSSVKTE